MKICSKQRGYALLLLVVLIMTATATVAVKALNHNNRQIALDRITAAALAQAKDALIGFAITYADNHSGQVHGYLPCPDISGTDIGGEGAAAGVCGAQDVSQIGRMPWKTLDLAPLRGGDNECLWYAVSGTYKNNPKTGLMNWDAKGLLQVYATDGTTLLTAADNQAVAVIFATGDASFGQNRSGNTAPVCGGNYTAANYLENATISTAANANSQFRQGNNASMDGDRLIYITKQDIWDAMQKRGSFLTKLETMTQQTAECIASFGARNNILTNKSLPWAAPLLLTDYTDNARYTDSNNLNAGRIPYKVNISQGVTGNSIASPFQLLRADGSNCPGGWAGIYPWWNNWKDHLFYAVGQNYAPKSTATTACGNCLNVNGSGKYAAVVIFAGNKLSSKTRADKSTATDYLEGSNPDNVMTAVGIENYQIDATSGAFNDIVYCITESLTVVKGNAPPAIACP